MIRSALLPLLCFALAQAQPAESPKSDILNTLRRDHPRVVVDGATFGRVRQLVKTEPLPQRWYRSIRQQADSLLSKPPSHYEIPDGRRLLSVSRQVKERVQILSLVYRIEGGRQYLDRAWKEAEAAARFKDWNPSHFLDTAEMTYALAVVYDWLHADLTADQRLLLRQAIVNLGLKPGMQVYQSKSGWHTNENNWNQVCNGGLAAGALAVADEEPVLAADILRNAVRSIPLAMSHYAPDGGGTEGATYWDYGARFNILLLSTLESALATDFGLSRIEGFRQSGLYQMYMAGAGRMSFNFADCGLRPLSTPMHFWLARKFGLPEYSWFRLSAFDSSQENGTVLDLLWYDASGRGYHPSGLPLDKHFRAAETASLRSSWTDPGALIVAIQAGENNNLRGHRHLDLGSFILDALGERWILDTGVERETYMSHRHKNPRWSFYRVRTEGHNTLVINPGPDPDQGMDAGARFTTFESSPRQARASVDLTQAYARHARKVERTFLLPERSSLLVTDKLETTAPSEVWWFAHTDAQVNLGPDRRQAVLTKNGKKFSARLENPAGARFEVLAARPLPSSPDPKPQESNQGWRKLAVHLTGVTSTELSVRFGR